MPYYHVWFATKNRKWLLQGEVGQAAKDLLQAVARDKDIRLIECETIVDHAHLLVEASDRQALSKAVNLLKGVSARRLFQRFPGIKEDARTNNFWQHRYACKVVDAGATDSVQRYIQTQWQRLDKFER